MTREELDILLSDEVRQAVRENINRDSLAVALDRHIPHAGVVATQVKYLTRARAKLPSYVEAGCILPSLQFEQSSSEQCASVKRCSGARVLDMTCGLGVDSLYLSRRFREVVAVERDEITAEIARENFRRLGVDNVEVVCADSAEYLLQYGDRFDWIYADPDRRSSEGRKMVRMEDCSPDMVALLPEIRRRNLHLAVKLSPLFDVDEARRLFGDVTVEVVSLGGECKEVMVYCDGKESRRIATAIDRSGKREEFSAEWNAERGLNGGEFDGDYRYLGVADVALQKARLTALAVGERCDVWSHNGFVFAAEPIDNLPIRWYEIVWCEEYSPRQLRRQFKGQRIEILKRDFPLSTAEICRACGIREGGEHRMAFTKIGAKYLAILLK